MLIVRGTDEVPEAVRGAVLAIGNFDGVHRGHKALIAKACERAAQLGTRAGVIVFEPHPREFFHPEEPHFRLTPLTEKARLLETLGIDVAVVLGFDRALSQLTAAEFIERILVERLGVAHVVIGYDFFFGKGRSGSPETMRLAGQELGFGTTVVAQQAEEGEVFSSTAIRLHLAQGDIAGATRALGHSWRITGRIEGGAKLGRELGFPTANLTLPRGVALAHGIYAVRVRFAVEVHAGAAYFGARPTVNSGEPRLEVFLLDFTGDLYDRELSIEFIAFLRGDRKFDSLEALKEQIAADCEAARGAIAEASEPAFDLTRRD